MKAYRSHRPQLMSDAAWMIVLVGAGLYLLFCEALWSLVLP